LHLHRAARDRRLPGRRRRAAPELLRAVRALVVDDSASARAALPEMLGTLGADAETVLTGLAQVAAASLPRPVDPQALAALIARLDAYLRAVAEIEYAAVPAPLAVLAARLDLGLSLEDAQ